MSQRSKMLVQLAQNNLKDVYEFHNSEDENNTGSLTTEILNKLPIEDQETKVYHYLKNVQLGAPGQKTNNANSKEGQEQSLSVQIPLQLCESEEFCSEKQILGEYQNFSLQNNNLNMPKIKVLQNIPITKCLERSSEIPIDLFQGDNTQILKAKFSIKTDYSPNIKSPAFIDNNNKTDTSSSIFSDATESSYYPDSFASSYSPQEKLSKVGTPKNEDIFLKTIVETKKELSIPETACLPLQNNFNKKYCNNGKAFCPFCYEEVGHFARHLLRKHLEEEAVKAISKLPAQSMDRRLSILSLRKRGNFIINQETDKNFKPVRNPEKNLNRNKENNFDRKNYVPCVYCLGYYKKSYLWRHKKQYKSKNECVETNSKIQHLSDAQTFLICTGLLGNFLEKSRLKQEVLNIMRPDDISFTAKQDPLICFYGESLLNKHKRKQMNVVVSSKMREMGRFKLALQKSGTISTLIEALKPEMYNHIVAAAKLISGYNPLNKTFKSSSLALHLGTSLKFLCDVARKAIVVKEPLFLIEDTALRTEKQKEILELREMIATHWCNDISSLANKVLNQAKWEKPKLLPVTEDIIIFKNYVMAIANKSYQNLVENSNSIQNFKLLAECTLCIVLVFNRKRVGEVQYLSIESYERNVSSAIQEESQKALSEFEKTMCSYFKRVVVSGKGSKPVPILLTKQMQTFIDLLLKIRRTTEIIPKTNKYVFAYPGSNDRWISAAPLLRKFSQKCGAKNPELLTSTRFRKQIATILQLTSFENDEMDQIARFMGHTQKTHLEFYRLTEDVYQTAKVAKVLLLLNAGKGSELKGKNLKEIEITKDILLLEENKENDLNNKNKQNTENEVEAEVINVDKSNQTGKIYEIKKKLQKCYKRQRENTDLITENEPLHKKISREKWTEKNKKLVLTFFATHVINKKAPKKQECMAFINLNLNLFEEKDWIRIKTLVYNTYRLK
ncbi:unnamed protein product [Diabrotica balteata]|uniref:Uncharacterized protein n=1 Tax=Diabrotica balteata TaxID=107213 RepID=A0A9N9SPV9_DIABA|nr:unnamed protein product [Diabrotica balteata]